MFLLFLISIDIWFVHITIFFNTYFTATISHSMKYVLYMTVYVKFSHLLSKQCI